MAFTEIFVENFNDLAAEGAFLSTYGVASGHATKWDAYPDNYTNTNKAGGAHYGRDNISVVSGISGADGNCLKLRLHIDSAGKPKSACPEPILPTGSKAQLYGFYEVRFKADQVANWKTAFLLWPFDELWPKNGEIDFPEGNLNSTIHAFMHRQDASGPQGGSDQDAFSTNVTYQNWHVARTEWSPNLCRFFLDGSLVGQVTSRVPNTRMRWALQTEIALSGPLPTTTANVYIDNVKIGSYSATTTPVNARTNHVPVPRPGRNLSKFTRYGAQSGVTNAYSEGDLVRIDHLAPADSGFILPFTLSPGVYTPSVDAQTFGAANNAAMVVKRQDNGTLLSEVHVSTTNTSKRLVGPSFTVTGTTVVEVVLAQGAYSGLSTGSVRFNNLLVEAGSTPGTYFDGDTLDTADINYAWAGTPYFSKSTASSVTTVPTEPPPTSPGTDPTLELKVREVWKGYKHRYLRFDGAVLQREADNKVPSEAPAYALNYAVQLDDRATFELVETFMENVLERKNWRPGGPDNWRAGSDNDPRVLAPTLCAWDYRVNPFNSKPANTVNDWNFATDADVDRARALYAAAAKGWGPNNGQDYRNKALQISLELDRYGHNVGENGLGYQTSDEYQQNGPITATGRNVGHHLFDTGGEFEVNPSYFDPVHDHLAKDIGKNANYSKHLAGGYDLLDKATNNTGGLSPNVGLVSDWVTFNTHTLDAFALTAGQRGWTNTRPNYQKYDGFRVWHRLRWAWDAYKDPEAKALLLRVAAFYQDEWNDVTKIAAEYELSGTRLSGGYDNTIFTAAAYLALSVDPTNSSFMATAAAIKAAELDPDDLYATDADGFKYWASDKDNTGLTQWSYYTDSWMMTYFLREAGLWTNFGQTTTPTGGVSLEAFEEAPTAVDSGTLSTGLGMVAQEDAIPDTDEATLSVDIRLRANETAGAIDEATLSVAGQPDTPAPPAPPVVVRPSATFLWVSRTTGKTFDLTHWIDGVAFIRGASGLIGGPPVRTKKEYRYGLPGAVYTQMIHDVKPVALPLVGITRGYEEMMGLVRKMVLMMDPITNDGILRYISKEGRVSELSAQCMGGLEVENLGDKGPNGQDFQILLEAVDPYWYSEVRSKQFKLKRDNPARWFGAGLFPPLTLGASTVVGEIVLNVASDVPTWPWWTVVGPGRNLSLANFSLKPPQLFALDDTSELQADEVINIDTRPRGETARTVFGPGETDDERNWFRKATSHSLWPLLPGQNQLEIVLAGASTASYVGLNYRDARETP